MCKIDWKLAPDDTIVCYCKNVDKQTTVSAIKSGASSMEKIKQTTNACTGNRCKQLHPEGRCCHRDIAALLDIYGGIAETSCDCCSGE